MEQRFPRSSKRLAQGPGVLKGILGGRWFGSRKVAASAEAQESSDDAAGGRREQPHQGILSGGELVMRPLAALLDALLCRRRVAAHVFPEREQPDQQRDHHQGELQQSPEEPTDTEPEHITAA